MTSLHKLKTKKHILLLTTLFVFVIESCQNHQIDNIKSTSEIFFEDFKNFPNKLFVQISFSNSYKDNQFSLLNNGFVIIEDDSYYRQTDSTTIFFNPSFDYFIVYLKSQEFLKQSQQLYDLIESHSSQLKGTPIFTEFKIELSNHEKYLLTFFKTMTFIRLKYELLKTKG
jgi:hypothetical protein